MPNQSQSIRDTPAGILKAESNIYIFDRNEQKESDEMDIPGEQEFLEYVRRNKHLGYGRMMQIISHEWHEHHPLGAHVTTECVGTLSDKKRREYEAVKAGDPLFRKR